MRATAAQARQQLWLGLLQQLQALQQLAQLPSPHLSLPSTSALDVGGLWEVAQRLGGAAEQVVVELVVAHRLAEQLPRPALVELRRNSILNYRAYGIWWRRQQAKAQARGQAKEAAEKARAGCL